MSWLAAFLICAVASFVAAWALLLKEITYTQEMIKKLRRDLKLDRPAKPPKFK